MRLCDRSKGRVCAKKREGVTIVKRRKRGSKGVHPRATEKGLYPTIEITTDGASVFCGKKGMEKKNGLEL